jgi:hypothetical protein
VARALFLSAASCRRDARRAQVLRHSLRHCRRRTVRLPDPRRFGGCSRGGGEGNQGRALADKREPSPTSPLETPLESLPDPEAPDLEASSTATLARLTPLLGACDDANVVRAPALASLGGVLGSEDAAVATTEVLTLTLPDGVGASRSMDPTPLPGGLLLVPTIPGTPSLPVLLQSPRRGTGAPT